LVSILPVQNILPKLVSEQIITIDDVEEIQSLKTSKKKSLYVLEIIGKSLEAGITLSFNRLLNIMEGYEGSDVTLLAQDIRRALIKNSGSLLYTLFILMHTVACNIKIWIKENLCI